MGEMSARELAKKATELIDAEMSVLQEIIDLAKAINDSFCESQKSQFERLIRKALCVVVMVFGFCANSFADYSVDEIADAIYLAEGGAKTSHPYGILKKYKTTTPRQACINTINHALRDWDGQGDFIQFLGNRYCPVGAENDPTGLNKNWVGNVTYFLQRG